MTTNNDKCYKGDQQVALENPTSDKLLRKVSLSRWHLKQYQKARKKQNCSQKRNNMGGKGPVVEMCEDQSKVSVVLAYCVRGVWKRQLVFHQRCPFGL